MKSLQSCSMRKYEKIRENIRSHINEKPPILIEKRSVTSADCIRSAIFPISKPNQFFNSLRLFCHIPLKRDQLDSDWRMRLHDTSNAIGCTALIRIHLYEKPLILSTAVVGGISLNTDLLTAVNPFLRWEATRICMYLLWNNLFWSCYFSKIWGHTLSYSLIFFIGFLFHFEFTVV